MAEQPKDGPPSLIDPVVLGDCLRAKRHGEGLSMREVAKQIGVSAPTLSRVERGQHREPVQTEVSFEAGSLQVLKIMTRAATLVIRR